MKAEVLNNYARLVASTGINVQKGQTIVVTSDISNCEFVRLLTDNLYECGAKEVIVRWLDEKITRTKYLKADPEVFKSVDEWFVKFFEENDNRGAGFISIASDDPELLKGVDQNRISDNRKAVSKAIRFHQENTMFNRNTWCVVSTPSPAWATKVFPNDSQDVAVEKLWEAIIKAARAESDPVAAWKDHNANLSVRSKKLNDLAFKTLRYKNSLGTDFTIDLPAGHIWAGGAEHSEGGICFQPNMPTEEIFTAPHRDGANGVVYSSMPLNYSGGLITEIKLTFKDGVVVDYDAKENKQLLKMILDTDEGATRLGEVALVPYSSPIQQLGILFYNTLFDENASCHLALGKAYATCLTGGTKMSSDELLKNGMNDSLTHVDFMIGTSDLSVIGQTADGKEVEIFRDGEFVI